MVWVQSLVDRLTARTYRLATVAMLGLISLACLVGIAIPAGLGWDFANYYDAGHKALIGQFKDLYDATALIGGQPALGEMMFLSTPITSLLYTPLALMEPRLALAVFKVQNTLVLWLAMGLIWSNTRARAGQRPADQALYAALFVAMTLVFQPLWTIYRMGGQITPTVLLLLTVGWLAHAKGRDWVSACCFVAAVAMKPFLIPGFVFLVLFSSRRFLVAAAVIGAASALVSIAVLGWPIHEAFLHRALLRTNEIVLPKYNSGFLSWLDPIWIDPARLQDSAPRPPALIETTNVLRLATGAVFLWLGLGARRQGEAGRGPIFMLAMVLPLFLSPVIWSHYLQFLLPLLAWTLAPWRSCKRGSLPLVAAILLVSVGQNLIFTLWLESQIGFDTRGEQIGIGLFNSLPLLLTLVLLLRNRAAFGAAFAGRSEGYGGASLVGELDSARPAVAYAQDPGRLA